MALEALGSGFSGSRELLAVQLVRLVEELFRSDRIVIPSKFHSEPLRRRILLSLSIDRIVAHLVRFLAQENRERVEPIFDEQFPIGSTGQMRTWYTTRDVLVTMRSQINYVVADSAWEVHAANLFESSPLVLAYAKNDHLGFQVHYLWQGARRRYVPDFLVRLGNGATLVLEVKGQRSDQTDAKQAAMRAWVEAVNTKGGFGRWSCDIAYEMAQLQDILAAHSGAGA